MTFTASPTWEGPSGDPRDTQFGDVITPTALEDAGSYPAVLVGEPYDGAVISRRGAAAAPAAIRDALAGIKAHHFDRGPIPAIGDLGDITIPDGPPSTVQDAVHEVTTDIHEMDTLPVFLGGDNSLTYPNVAPLLEYGSVGVLSFDAHLDCRVVEDEPSSGSPYRQLYDAGLATLSVIGARHFETSTDYHTYLIDQGGRVTTAVTVTQDPTAVVRECLDAIAVDTLYVSVDVDVLDAATAPGVSAPTPGGVPSVALFEAVRVAASDDRIAGLEVVECAPPLDESGRTVDATARIIAHLLGGAIT